MMLEVRRRLKKNREILMLRARRRGAVDCFFFFSSRRRHTRFDCDWSSDVCSSDLLRDLSFTVAKNEFVAIVGPSGCGKSTILRLVSGLLPVTTGRVAIYGHAVIEIGRASCRERV